MKEIFIAECPYDCSKLSPKEIHDAYEEATSSAKSNVINVLFSASASKQGVSQEQFEFNHAICAKLKEKERKISLEALNKKWIKHLDSGEIDKAKRERFKKELITTANQWLNSETTLLKPTKSSIGKVIRWSSSRWAEMRKADVVAKIYNTATMTDLDYLFLNEYSSGSVCQSGSLNGSGHYSLLRVNGVTLLNANGKAVYRFVESLDFISESLNSFECDETLLALLEAYESDYNQIKGDTFDF